MLTVAKDKFIQAVEGGQASASEIKMEVDNFNIQLGLSHSIGLTGSTKVSSKF
jgi:hypothetical protein